MELQIGTDEFSRALYRAQGIVEKKSTMPILGSVLLEATEDGRLRVSAFDLEIGVTGTHPCEVRKGGGVAIKHKELYDIVRALPVPREPRSSTSSDSRRRTTLPFRARRRSVSSRSNLPRCSR